MRMLSKLHLMMMDLMMKWKISNQKRRTLMLKDKVSLLKFMVNSTKKEILPQKLLKNLKKPAKS
jgi:hypothetical protein